MGTASECLAIDESFIDYVTVASTNNANPVVNIIANTEVMNDAQRIDVSTITPVLLTRLNQLGGVAEYIATGYHAIEFLLWGQDINKTGSGAGDRPLY